MYHKTKSVLMQNAAVATGNGVVIDVKDVAVAVLQVVGTFVGTVTFEGTVDESTWVAIQAANLNDGVVGSTATAPGLFFTQVAGLSKIRARVSSWSSGSITVDGLGSSAAVGATMADIDISVGDTIALAASTATIGKLGANDGVDIGDVDIASIAAGETHIGQIGTHGKTISQTPTVTAGAYSANDAVGGLLTFADAARVSGGGGVIKDLLVLDDAGQDAQMELWLFKETFTAISDNAAWAPSEADLRKLVAVISSTSGTWFAAGTPSILEVEASQRYDLTGTSMFGQLVTRGTPTFAATDDVTVIVGLLQD